MTKQTVLIMAKQAARGTQETSFNMIYGFADTRYGKLRPSRWKGFYSSPQAPMLIFTVLLTVSVEVVMMKAVFHEGLERILVGSLCIYILYLQVALGLSNPGFAFEQYEWEQMERDFDVGNSYKPLHDVFPNYCHICRIPIRRSTKHCKVCEVCVCQYDHHCVFIGKCVAKDNLCMFKRFLLCISVVLAYALVSQLLAVRAQTINAS